AGAHEVAARERRRRRGRQRDRGRDRCRRRCARPGEGAFESVPVRGIRGATTATANTEEAITEATDELLRELTQLNDLDLAEIVVVVYCGHACGRKTESAKGEERTLVGVIGGNAYAYKEAFSHLGGIHEIIPITKPFKLASREFRPVDTVVDVGGVKIGSDE